MSKKVAVVMGSDSDLDTMRPCVKRLRSFGIETQVRIISAHRTPAAAEALAAAAKDEGFGVIIAAAGKAVTPGGAVEICHVLGREETLRRLRLGLDKLR